MENQRTVKRTRGKEQNVQRFHRNKTRDTSDPSNKRRGTHRLKYTRRSGQRGTGDTNHQKKEVCKMAQEVKTFKIIVKNMLLFISIFSVFRRCFRREDISCEMILS